MTLFEYDNIHLEFRDFVATVTLNRSEKLNALNAALVADLHNVLDDLAADQNVRAIIITGAGRGFCSGADVNQQLDSLEGRPPEPQGPPTVELGPHIRLVPQPVITAINGIAAGAGLAIALASDIRIASISSSFSSIFVKRSLVPDTGSSYTLAKLVGHGIALEMALTGNIYDSQWALEKGLVNKIVPDDSLLSEAHSLATTIASNPPIATRAIKELLYEHNPNLYEILPKESLASSIPAKSEDRLEAVRSFLEKRPPFYIGL